MPGFPDQGIPGLGQCATLAVIVKGAPCEFKFPHIFSLKKIVTKKSCETE